MAYEPDAVPVGDAPVERRAVLLGTAGLLGAAASAPLFAAATATATGSASAGEAVLQVPARTIPVPSTISPEARRFLAAGTARLNASRPATEPPATDIAAQKAMIAAVNQSFAPMVDRMLASAATVERRTIAGVSVAVGTPNRVSHSDRTRLCIHGGGFTLLGGRFVMGDAAQAAADAGCVAYSVDYRMPPDFPYPAAVDDCVAVYRELIKTRDPRKLAISGASAGGNLSAAVVLRIRDMGLPLPGAVGLMTPAGDLSAKGDSWQTNYRVDTVLTQPDNSGRLVYTRDHDLSDPYISPVFGDFGAGFPPTFLQSGTRDRLLSDTVRLHRALLRAGVEAELHVWEAMPHGGFGGFSPEDEEIRTQFIKFIDKHLPA